MLDKRTTHKCVFAVTTHGEPVLLKSNPDLLEFDVFDGNDLRDNIIQNPGDIPSVFGIYSCDVVVEVDSYNNAWEIEYDVNTSISNIIKLNIENL